MIDTLNKNQSVPTEYLRIFDILFRTQQTSI